MSSYRRIGLYAICAFVFNLSASVMAHLYLKQGSILINNPLDRMNYITEYKVFWQLTWFNWFLAAVTFVVLFAMIARLASKVSITTGRISIYLIFAGLCCDLIGQLFAAYLVPYCSQLYLADVPSMKPLRLSYFLSCEDFYMILIAVAGNGLYTLGGTILFFLMLRSADFPRLLVYLLIFVGIPAYAFSVCSLLRYIPLAYIFATILMISFVVWTFLLGLSFLLKRTS